MLVRKNLLRRQARFAHVQSPSLESKSAFKIDLPKLGGDGAFAERLKSDPKVTTVNVQGPKFDVIGTPFSLLNASIPANGILYTRRGSLVGLNGPASNIYSTLSVFNSGLSGTASRVLGGIPFLYQKLTSPAPFTALIGTKATASSFAVLELDGRLDWNVTSRKSLLAWSGIVASPKQDAIDRSVLKISTNLSGRGSAVVAGTGQIYQIVLEAGEQYVVNPGNVIAYAVSCPKPEQVKLQFVKINIPIKIPSLSNFLSKYEFFRVMATTGTWKSTKRVGTALKRFARKLVWGNQLLCKFEGPTTILLQSRSSANFVEEKDPIEAVPVQDNQQLTRPSTPNKTYSGSLKVATVRNGQVELTDTPSF